MAKPIQDNSVHIYGIGQGNNLHSATQSALEALAGKLATQIASSLSIDSRSINNQVSEWVDSNVHSQISNTHISGYRLSNVEEANKTFWVQVEIEREKLLNANLTQANLLVAKLDSKFAGNGKQNAIALHNESTELQNTINEAISKLTIVKGLEEQFEYEAAYSRLLGYSELLRNFKNEFRIHVVSDKDLKLLATQVADLLSQEGYPASVTSSSESTPTIKLNGSFSESKQFDSIFAFARVVVEVRDEHSKPILSRELTMNGSSMTSFDNAKVAAVNKLAQQLEDDGVAASLGLID